MRLSREIALVAALGAACPLPASAELPGEWGWLRPGHTTCADALDRAGQPSSRWTALLTPGRIELEPARALASPEGTGGTVGVEVLAWTRRVDCDRDLLVFAGDRLLYAVVGTTGEERWLEGIEKAHGEGYGVARLASAAGCVRRTWLVVEYEAARQAFVAEESDCGLGAFTRRVVWADARGFDAAEVAAWRLQPVGGAEPPAPEVLRAWSEAARFAPDARLWPAHGGSPWPWNWKKKLPREFVEERLRTTEGSRPGIRYVRPAGWRSPAPGETGGGLERILDGAVCLGWQPIDEIGLGGRGEIELGFAQVPCNESVQPRFERELERLGARVVRAAQYRRPAVRVTDVLARDGGGVRRWVAVQSGWGVALLRLSMEDVESYRAIARTLARTIASLEPCPLGHRASAVDVDPGAGDASHEFELPRAWTADGAEAEVQDFLSASSAPPWRLCLRPGLRSRDGDAAWTTLGHPIAGREVTAAGPGHDTRTLARILTLGAGWAEIRMSRVRFAGGELPVYWCDLERGERSCFVALVCAGDDEAALAEGRAQIEFFVGGFRFRS
jgi:hypothetical protein